ncbi:MAG: prolyl 4-hydroxylase [Lysobacteraceae bacterium]|nr:MAG: prolyl 4-hydroxylase [Xanthomonadaceae bacterium]
MTPSFADKLATYDWAAARNDLDRGGYHVLPELLSKQQCMSLVQNFDAPSGFRKTVVMERHQYGLGQYKYWDYPLPAVVQQLRTSLYPHLVPVANAWMQQLRMERRFPATHQSLIAQCRKSGQSKPTPLILKYQEGGFNMLHQDIYGEVFFPMQAEVLLSEPGVDFTGGEFVLTQQSPRMQAKPIVVRLGQGDMIIFTTNFRPVEGKRGYHRATIKHGVSPLRSGQRLAMGVIFHDAET